MNQYNPYQKAAKAYQGNKDANLSPLQIVVELYKGMLRNIREAKLAVERQDYQTYAKLSQKTFDIVEALQANLDVDNGGEDAKFLLNFYSVIFQKHMRVLSQPDPAAELQKLLDYIQPVYERWYGFAYGKVPDANSTSADAAPVKSDI